MKMGPTRGGAVRLSHGAATLRLLLIDVMGQEETIKTINP